MACTYRGPPSSGPSVVTGGPEMHLANRLRPSSRFLMRGLLLVALGAASIALTHCQMISDNVTGVNVVSVMKAKSCIDVCQKTADAQLRDEHRTNEHNLKARNGDATCIQQEDARD